MQDGALEKASGLCLGGELLLVCSLLALGIQLAKHLWACAGRAVVGLNQYGLPGGTGADKFDKGEQ